MFACFYSGEDPANWYKKKRIMAKKRQRAPVGYLTGCSAHSTKMRKSIAYRRVPPVYSNVVNTIANHTPLPQNW